MEAKEMCEKFIAADTFYDGKNANITLEEIKKKQGFEKYCRNQTCDTRNKIIGALSAYLFMNTRGTEDYGQYDEFFLMWLSDKLFEIVNDENKAQSKDITLNEAYDKYLKKNIKNGSYWSFLDSKKGLKEANLKYMKDFYKLLNHICSTILDYKKNGAESMSLLQNSTNCSNQYMFLYKHIYKCKSYLHLLDNLKKIYYNFRDSAMNENEKKKKKLAISLQTLTKPNGEDLFFTDGFKAFDFNNSECKPKKTKKPGSPKKEKQPPLPLPLKGTPPVAPLQPSNQLSDNQNETPPAPKPQTTSQNDAELQTTKIEGSSHKNGSGVSDDAQKGSQNSLRSPDGEQGNTGDTTGNKGNSNSENGNSDDGSSHQGSGGESGTSETQSTSWSYFGIGSYISTIASKGKEQLNNAVTALETIKKKVTETTNTIQNLYSRSVSNIQTAYDKSRNLLYGAIDNISSYSKQVGNIFIQNDDQLGSDDTKNGLPTPSDPSQTPKDSPQTQKDSSQTSSKIPHTSLPSSSNGQIKTPQLSQGPPGNQSSDQNNQGGSKIPVANPVVKPENSVTKIKGNETTGIGGIYAFKKYKQIGISIIVILIPISLAIMYKYLSFGWRKELKKKKSMKKVMNSIGGKRSMQIIIKSVDTKKISNPVINPVRGERKSPLNIYKLMQADPVPFINLFFLLIFFVYKRKLNYLGL
ncbi:PIR protein CIR protein [Plasmodium vinckei brucechwatti]|uniref:PIR protein CIR protein n=1 Tax=Plasmodium vinckei brucechwatti TaxID=119398 RepID=A0A6V7SDI5_PLAVN|nr:PIR protein CIR protein [Plasmodium vinckei brucechwatti]